MDLLPSVRSVQKYLSRNLPEVITSRVRCLANEDRRIGEVSWDAIATGDFAEQYADRSSSNRLNIEFKAVEKCDMVYPQEIASLPTNEAKNAHKVLPYDHNRIILRSTQSSQDSEDYINASLVEGYDDQTYIAAQGPVAGTLNDFWQMIWQQGAEVIVMLTDLFSYSKQQCEKYWHHTYNLYGDVHVRQDFVIDACHYSLRRFHISKVGHCERAVDHWQFHHWDEHGLPDMNAILELRRKVKACATSKHLPIIIHCSDGSGRTGTFIALDMVLDKLRSEGIVDVINIVKFLRTFRQKMVSSVSQYKFVYSAVYMHLQCGVTVIGVSRLVTEATGLSSNEAKAVADRSEKEFEILARIVQKIKVSDCAAGHRAENHSKSRDIMIQPPERARPYLMTFDSSDNSDYFNAVYVNGHRRLNEFIVSQWPLRCTVNDYWRLVYDCHISTCVVLHDDSTSQAYPQFWPDEKGTRQRFGPIASTFIGSETRNGLVVKSFLIKKAIVNPSDVAAYGNETKQVKVMFLSKGAWPDSQEIPSPLTASPAAPVGVASRSGLLAELLLATRSWQESSSTQSSSVLVISRDGVSRAGIYCAANIVYERLLDEDEVDVFSAVRSVKENRPQLVGTPVEYNYCYAVATDLAEAYIATVKDMTTGCSSRSNSQGILSREDRFTQSQAKSLRPLNTATSSSGCLKKVLPLCTQEDDSVSSSSCNVGPEQSACSTIRSSAGTEVGIPRGLEGGDGEHLCDNQLPQASCGSRAEAEALNTALCNDSSLATSQRRLYHRSPLLHAHTVASVTTGCASNSPNSHVDFGLLQEQNVASQVSHIDCVSNTRCSNNRQGAHGSNADARDGSREHVSGASSTAVMEATGNTVTYVHVHSHERQNGHLPSQQKGCEKD